MNLRIKPNKLDIHYPNLKVGKLVQTMLKSLGLSEEQAQQFLKSHTLELEDPFNIFGMDQAVEVIEKAIQSNQKIAIHGDFDVDGTSATAILWDYLYYERGIQCLPIIPHRVDEGYGLSVKTIEKAIAWGANLIITVDCGIKDAAIVDDYKERIDFVITDHHQFATDSDGMIVLPGAKAVVHSAHPESMYSTMISGGATSWQLVRALEIRRQQNAQKSSNVPSTESKQGTCDVNKYVDLVALSTVCDIIPLTLENRKLIQKGLAKIGENSRVGLAELMKISGVDPKLISAYHFGFVLGPRLNAPGRVTNDAMDSVRILSTRNKSQAEELAAKLNELNIKRQDLTSRYMAIAEEQLQPELKAIVVLGHEWPEGILGLIAGKLAEKHFKPTFVASVGEGGQIIGSSRSPLDAFYLNKALEYAKDHLTRFGGHKQAAGFASTEEMFPGFGDKVLEFIENNTTEDDFERMIEIDLTLDRLDEITIDDVEELSLLEPHGVGNTKPLFQLKNCLIMNYSRIGKEANHLKLALKMDSVEFEAIGFSMVEKYPNLHAGQIVDIVGNLSVNTWNGRKKLQVEIKHILEVPNL